ncbi:MAG: glycosyltransferase family 9 protein [Phycisphaerales bacterium]|nr:glycosyltransferase family 9 protein [Phycisphaerales bacterium]
MLHADRILIIRPSALGDVCRTVPVLVSLRRAWPAARIDWLVNDSFAPAVAAHPDLLAHGGRALPFPRTGVAVGKLLRATREGTEARRRLRAFRQELRDGRYDLVVDCQGLARSGVFAWWTGAPMRVGYSARGGARELAWLGVNRRVDVPAEMHTVDRMLALVEGLGINPVRPPDLRLHTAPADREAVQAGRLDPRLAGGARFAVIAPGAKWAGKRWPADRFAALIRAMLAESGTLDAVAVVGTKDERGQCQPVLDLARRDRRVVDLMGRTSVGVLMAAIERARLVVANDSAAVHMAVGFGRPLVALYGPTRIDLVGPYGRSADVLQPRGVATGRALHKDQQAGAAAMLRIEVATVIEAAAARLSSERSP